MGIKIMSGGFMTTIQDMGRFGYQETGMSVSGVMDTRSTALANILVGNEESEAVLEITMMGPMIEFTESIIVALTGGDLGAKLDGSPMPRYQAVTVKAGQTLSFGAMAGGTRAYLAFAGGLDVPIVMGSKSTNLKSAIGGLDGRKLGAGDEIEFTDPKTWIPNLNQRQLEPPSYQEKEYTLRVLMGPQDDCFTEAGIQTFLQNPYTITNEYDRMGCRLEGALIEHKNGGDIITDGISFGAVQVPSHGNPIVMMADHQTTGGYTKIANVISVDLPVLAQCMPGYRIRFEAVDIETAQELYCAQKAEFQALKAAWNTITEPAEDVEAVALAAAVYEEQSGWWKYGTYRVFVNGEEVLVDLKKRG